MCKAAYRAATDIELASHKGSIINSLRSKRLLGFVALLVLVSVVLHYAVLPCYDKSNNAVMRSGPFVVSEQTRAFHEQAFVADLHADSLLWGRDLSQRYQRGHLDLPRLQQGGVDLQVFSVVSKIPSPVSPMRFRDGSDRLPLLFMAAWRDPASWFSAKARARVQARELTQLVDRTSLSLVLKRDDLTKPGVKALLALEGMQAFEGDEAFLDAFFALGYRMMGLSHFYDNRIAGSSFGIDQYGLTALGRKLIPEMERLGITIDLAHASSAALTETLALATKPVVVSHGGVAGTCPGSRNLTDDQLRAVADNGGVIGIGYWKAAVCSESLDGIVAAIRYAVGVAGIDHVGLGSDFDGHVATPFDVTGLPLLTAALFDQGLSESDIGKILGGNVRRLLASNLPE